MNMFILTFSELLKDDQCNAFLQSRENQSIHEDSRMLEMVNW